MYIEGKSMKNRGFTFYRIFIFRKQNSQEDFVERNVQLSTVNHCPVNNTFIIFHWHFLKVYF